ncbi:MAG: hypothetical protein ACRD3W_00330, partial [Terriglobales bacterium]
MLKANAYANNGTVLVAWSTDADIPNCLGIAVARINAKTGAREVLPAWVPFQGQDNSEWKAGTTEQWPIQKMSWMDYLATKGETVKYEVTPMVGTPDKLTADTALRVVSNEVTVSPACGPYIDAGFTKGVLSNQWVSKAYPTAAEGGPDLQKLIDDIKTPGNPTREKLANGIIDLLMAPLRQAKELGGHTYEATYELSDPQIVDEFLANPKLFSMILGNTGPDDETNKPARAALHKALVDIIDRFLDRNGIPHNKSSVYVDAKGKPQMVRTGSTNLTFTGICCQSNNCVNIRSSELAQLFIDYWQALKTDSALDQKQSPEFRAANAQRRKEVVLKDGTRITVWFSP